MAIKRAFLCTVYFFSQTFLVLDDIEMGPSFEDNIEGEVWLSRSDGSVTVLGCNQYGWLDSKVMDPSASYMLD